MADDREEQTIEAKDVGKLEDVLKAPPPEPVKDVGGNEIPPGVKITIPATVKKVYLDGRIMVTIGGRAMPTSDVVIDGNTVKLV